MTNLVNLGIDVGGTKTELIALDSQSGKELWRKRVPTIRGDYAASLKTISELVAEAEQHLGQKGNVGLGIPGTICPQSGVVKNANSTWLNGFDLKGDLAKILGREIRIANDADCFALSEATDGAGAGQPIVFGVILGTGVGAGVVVHGRILSGPNAIAGEWGHNPLHENGPDCYCGRMGCVETYLCGPALERDAGLDMRATEIGVSNDPRAQAAMLRYEENLARALGNVINILDPHVIVLGGGLGGIARLYENAPKLWGQHVFSNSVVTKLVPPKFGDSSGVRGAAWLWNKA